MALGGFKGSEGRREEKRGWEMVAVLHTSTHACAHALRARPFRFGRRAARCRCSAQRPLSCVPARLPTSPPHCPPPAPPPNPPHPCCAALCCVAWRWCSRWAGGHGGGGADGVRDQVLPRQVRLQISNSPSFRNVRGNSLCRGGAMGDGGGVLLGRRRRRARRRTRRVLALRRQASRAAGSACAAGGLLAAGPRAERTYVTVLVSPAPSFQPS